MTKCKLKKTKSNIDDFLDSKSYIYSYSYNKAYGLTLGFVLSVFFCSKIESPLKRITYLFFVGNEITKDELLFQKRKLTEKFLLNLIFKNSKNKNYISKKDLREITGLKTKPTFNKYFGEFLKANGLFNKRKFTLYELYKILKYWQGDDKWIIMKAFTKKVLSEKITSGNYEFLEEKINYTTKSSKLYKKHNYISPNIIKSSLDDSVYLKAIEDNEVNYVEFLYQINLYKQIEEIIENKRSSVG